MYKALEQESKTLKKLPGVKPGELIDRQRLEVLCNALDTTAQELNSAAQSSPSPEDSANLAKLYQGALAAKRIINNLYERTCHLAGQTTVGYCAP